MIRLTLDPQGDRVSIALGAYLGERFAAYRAACAAHGAVWHPASRTNRAPVGAIPGLLAAFGAAGLAVTVDPAIRARLAEQASEAQALLAAGRARLERAERELGSRGLSLYPYQRTGVEWLAPRRQALLCDEMGLGKTVQALLSLPECAAALVIVPAAVRYAWRAEAARWRPDLRATVLTSGGEFRWPARGEIAIATYGIMRELGTPPGELYLIADEAHLLKSPRAARTKRWRALADAVRAHGGATWAMTGTPLLNRPPELWAVLQACGCAEAAFGSWPRFVEVMAGARGRYGYTWGTASEQAPECLRRVSLHRRRREVLPDLPPKRRQNVSVNGLDRATVAVCDRAVEALAAAGVDLQRAVEVAEWTVHGAAFEALSRARAALATAKTPAALELVESYEEAEEPLVVFSSHRAPVDAIGARPGWAAITGDTSADERGRIVERFQRGELRGVAGTIAAMGVGVTLTRAAHVLFVDLDWTPARNNQAEDRVCRIGQDRGVMVLRLVAQHALDERVADLLARKQELIDATVTASAVEADHVHPSPAESLAKAAAQASALVVEADATAQKAREQFEREQDAERARVARTLGARHDGRALDVRGAFRSAANDEEQRAAEGLVMLASLDRDHARILNGVGFSQSDGEFGHSLAAQFTRTGRLSERQWAAALKLAHRYRRQLA